MTRTYTKGIMLMLAAGTLLTSCVQKNYYNTEPDHNNNPSGYRNEFLEDFSNDNNGWGFTSSQDSAYANVQSGDLEFVNYAYNALQTSTVGTGANMNGDFKVSAQVKSNNKFGIVFGASGSDYGYSFNIDSMGNFQLYDEGTTSQAGSFIVKWVYSSAVIPRNWNTLTVEQKDGFWTGTINGTQVFRESARPINGAKCGFIVFPNTVGYADNLSVKW